MLLSEFFVVGAGSAVQANERRKIPVGAGYFMPLLLALLAGCGLKVFSVSDMDRYCFACQTTGYAQCRTKAAEQPVSMTRDEAEKVLSVIEVKQAAPEKEGPVAVDTTKPGMPVRIDGYKKY